MCSIDIMKLMTHTVTLWRESMGSVKDKTRKRIMDAAKASYLRYGIANTSMDTIAKDCNITRRTLYRHFDNKNHLAVAVVTEQLNRFNKYQDDLILDINGDGITILETFLFNLLEYLAQNIDIIRLMGEFDFIYTSVNEMISDSNDRDDYNQSLNTTERIIADILHIGIGDKSIPIDTKEVDVITYTISNTLWAFGQRAAMRKKQIEYETGIETMELLCCQIRMYINALKK